MITFIEGKITPVTEYYLNDIKKNYISNYTVTYELLEYAVKKAKKLVKPVFAKKYLIIIRDNFNPRQLQKKLKVILECQEHPYVDFVVCLPQKCTVKDKYLEGVTILDISKSYREDFVRFAKEALYPTEFLDEDTEKFFFSRIKYNYDRFMIYLIKLKTTNILTKVLIKQIITEKPLDNLNTILIGIVNKDSRALRGYFDYGIKYSNKWLKKYTIDTLHSVLKYKLQIMKGQLKVTDINSRERIKPLKGLILKTNIYDVYNCLRTFEHNIPVESYMIMPRRYYLTEGIPQLEGITHPVLKSLL